MTRALVAFGSLTGNTAEVADWVAEALQARGIETTMVDAADAKPAGLCSPYDLVVFGCPTYGEDEVEIQEDFEPILDALEATGVAGKKVAVFGLGDDTYDNFCGAVDQIESRVRDCRGSIVVSALKINDPHDEHKSEIRDWAKQVAQKAS